MRGERIGRPERSIVTPVLEVGESALPKRGQRAPAARLDPELWEKLSASSSGTRYLDAREVLTEAGDRLEASALLLDGSCQIKSALQASIRDFQCWPLA
jgi:hypothetical protein